MIIEPFFDANTYTLTYIVYDQNSKDAVIIDPVLDYDPHASKITTTNVERYAKFIEKESLNLLYTLETHAHADHLSSSIELKRRYPKAKVGISKNITKVQDLFKDVFSFKDLKTDGSQFDIIFSEGETINAGTLSIEVIETPGHTPACVSFKIEDCVFVGDAMFMPDYGTGRCDFPAGSAEDLYHSVHEKIYKLPESTKLYVGHDYQPGGREVMWQTTVLEAKKSNIQLKEETSKDDYVKMRTERDAILNAPRLILQSVQVNINAGELPFKDENGTPFLKMPVSKSID